MRRSGQDRAPFSVALPALLAALTACTFPADYEGTRYQCAQDAPGECPDGYECRTGFCEAVRPGQDSGGAFTDAGVAPDDAAPVPDADVSPDCEEATSIEGFGGGAAWNILGEQGCEILFFENQVGMQSANGDPVGLCSSRTRDEFYLDGRVSVEVLDSANGSPASGFGLVIGDQTFLLRHAAEGLLVALREGDDAEQTLAALPYDPFVQRFWAVRRGVGDVVEIETSPDAKTWTSRGQLRPALDPRTTCLRFEVSIVAVDTSTETVLFQNLNDIPRKLAR